MAFCGLSGLCKQFALISAVILQILFAIPAIVFLPKAGLFLGAVVIAGIFGVLVGCVRCLTGWCVIAKAAVNILIWVFMAVEVALAVIAGLQAWKFSEPFRNKWFDDDCQGIDANADRFKKILDNCTATKWWFTVGLALTIVVAVLSLWIVCMANGLRSMGGTDYFKHEDEDDNRGRRGSPAPSHPAAPYAHPTNPPPTQRRPPVPPPPPARHQAHPPPPTRYQQRSTPQQPLPVNQLSYQNQGAVPSAPPMLSVGRPQTGMGPRSPYQQPPVPIPQVTSAYSRAYPAPHASANVSHSAVPNEVRSQMDDLKWRLHNPEPPPASKATQEIYEASSALRARMEGRSSASTIAAVPTAPEPYGPRALQERQNVGYVQQRVGAGTTANYSQDVPQGGPVHQEQATPSGYQAYPQQHHLPQTASSNARLPSGSTNYQGQNALLAAPAPMTRSPYLGRYQPETDSTASSSQMYTFSPSNPEVNDDDADSYYRNINGSNSHQQMRQPRQYKAHGSGDQVVL